MNCKKRVINELKNLLLNINKRKFTFKKFLKNKILSSSICFVVFLLLTIIRVFSNIYLN